MTQTRQRTGAPLVAPATVLGDLMLPMTVPPGPDTRATDELEGTPRHPAPGMAWTLNIAARSTIWKYWLLGDWRDRELTLVDLTGQIEFAPPMSEALPDGRVATVIRSRTPIALRERPPHRFQLRDARSSPAKVLVPRMPIARPDGLGREWQSGDTHLVSEIFVSR